VTIFGFNNQKKILDNYFKSEYPSGSFLFHGQEMIGKKTLALELANKHITRSGGSATHDLLFIDSSHSDSGQTISIDKIREAKKFLSLSPFGGKLKFVIIDNAHEMQEEAQNSILKIIEEPPSYAIMILISHKTDTILPTILSRCQKFYFPAHSPQVISKILNDNNTGLSEEQIKFVSDFSNGRTGMVFNILKENSFKDIKKAVQKLSDLISSDIHERFLFVANIVDKSKAGELEKTILYWMLYLRPKLTQDNDGKSKADVVRMAKNLLKLHYTISNPHYNKRLAMENFVLTL